MGAKHTQRFALARFLLLSGGTGHCTGEALRACCCYPDSRPPRGVRGAARLLLLSGMGKGAGEVAPLGWRPGVAVGRPGLRLGPARTLLAVIGRSARGGITGCCYHPYV